MLAWLFLDKQKNAAAVRIQAIARGRKSRANVTANRPELERGKSVRVQAAARIAARFRGGKTREQVSVLRGERQLSDAQTKSGFLEKRSAKRSFVFGPRQVVLWQRKFVSIDDFHFCYGSRAPRKRGASGALHGEKRIPLREIHDILMVEGREQFILVTPRARLHFQCRSAVDSQAWINTISLLRAYLREQDKARAPALPAFVTVRS